MGYGLTVITCLTLRAARLVPLDSCRSNHAARRQAAGAALGFSTHVAPRVAGHPRAIVGPLSCIGRAR